LNLIKSQRLKTKQILNTANEGGTARLNRSGGRHTKSDALIYHAVSRPYEQLATRHSRTNPTLMMS